MTIFKVESRIVENEFEDYYITEELARKQMMKDFFSIVEGHTIANIDFSNNEIFWEDKTTGYNSCIRVTPIFVIE